MRFFNNGQRTKVAAVLGVLLVLAGTRYAGAESTATATYPVIGKSFFKQYVGDSIPLPRTPPTYSQINFNTRAGDPNLSGGLITTTQEGQMHAEAALLLRKPSGAGAATVTCDLRVSGLPLSHEYQVNLTDASGVESIATLTLVGSFNRLPAGVQNVGIRCWSPDRSDIVMEKADLHAVVYANAPTNTP